MFSHRACVRLALMVLVLSAALFSQGCYALPVSLAASTIPLIPGSYTEVGDASGSSYAISILGFPLSEPNPTGRARDRAISGANADALVNVACDSYVYNLGPVGIIITNVTGTGVTVN